jgi:hypothetical protein
MEKIMHQHQIKQLTSLKKQVGATLLGMLFVGAMIFFVALIAMKIFPAYEEYFSVKTVIGAMNKESMNSMSKKDIQSSFDRRADIGYITVISGKDLTIEKDASGEVKVSAQYQVVKPLFGNISALMDFTVTADGK